ncbi:MAG: Xaa-Pro peptidase family protein [Desulfobacterales bacterium]|nr:Xaa-Pro peptidase family protein [Desulfobacterales bacterium]
MNNIVSLQELKIRWERCRNLMGRFSPQAEGLLIFSRLNIYYFTGSFASGVLWLPVEGDPVLLCKRGVERAKLESPIDHIYPFRSYKDIEVILKDLGYTISCTIGAEMNGLTWALSNSLTGYMADCSFIPADIIIRMCRAKKTKLELEILREAGARHNKCLTELLPVFIREGMSELEIGHKVSEVFFSEGHLGMLRMENYGEEVYLGHISVGDSGNYPSVFNGPLGLRGVHPAVPFIGSEDVIWTAGTPLTIDNGFTYAGYMSDKTQVYWLGNKKNIPAKALKAQAFCTDLQNRIAERLKPGTRPDELWNLCLEKTENSEWQEGFMGLNGNKVFFVGHGIGLAIDEFPALAGGFDMPLEEGMVLAVEPKIGIPDFGMVGVENTFEVTADGGKSLTGENFEIITI